jgi:hypothetical protein
MSDVNNSIAAALASLTTAIATLASETARARGFTSALEARIAALEAKAAMPTVIPTVVALERRGPELTTFERVSRPVRDGQW